MTYFILTSGEDGTRIEQVTEAELHKRITPDKHGDHYYSGSKPTVFLGSVPEDDKGCWRGVDDNAVLVIKGDIIIPQAVQTVTKYELPN
jgi:hypothetical protein